MTKVAGFLGENLSADEVENVVRADSFDEMKKLDRTQKDRKMDDGNFAFLRIGV